MATAQPWNTGVTCRYFVHGVCRNGSSCNFSHDLQNSQSPQVCKYYLRGGCTFGDRCRFDHTRPSEQSSQANTSFPGPRVSSRTTSSSQGKTTPKNWAHAKEFVPGKRWKPHEPKNYAEAIRSGLSRNQRSDKHSWGGGRSHGPRQELCPYAAHGECPYGDTCTYLHGDVCDICNKAVLYPSDSQQNAEHRKSCVADVERDMEAAFAAARSADMVCGVCMEKVKDKEKMSERKFGILSSCNHVFCLSCIRTWRQAKQFEHKVVKACPECRVKSNFVTPSEVWVEAPEEKKQLIQSYKGALSKKACKHFDQGRGECPFNMHCFYKHAYPDGTLEERKPRPRRRRERADGTEMEDLQDLVMWDFIEQHGGVFDIHDLLFNMGDSFDEDLILMSAMSSDDDSDDDDDFSGLGDGFYPPELFLDCTEFE